MPVNLDKNLRDSNLYEEKFRFKEGQSNIRFCSILLFILMAILALVDAVLIFEFATIMRIG